MSVFIILPAFNYSYLAVNINTFVIGDISKFYISMDTKLISITIG